MFTPITLDPRKTAAGVKLVLQSLLNAPLTALLSTLLFATSWLVYLVWLKPKDVSLGFAAETVLPVLFVFAQAHIPALAGSFMMYKQTYRQSLTDFLQNIKAVGYYRVMLRDALGYTCVFTIMHIIILLAEPKNAQPANQAYMAGGAEFPLWVVLPFLLFFFLIGVFFWVGFALDRSVSLRTGLSVEHASNYVRQARRMNPKLMPYSIVFILLLFFIIVQAELPLLATAMFLALSQIVLNMFWIYVLFGNTFPTRAKSRSTSTAKVGIANT